MPDFLVDTSVVVAALSSWHEHHRACLAALEEKGRRQWRMFLGAPVLVETYAVLTRLPAPHRLAPAVAHQLLTENFRRTRIAGLTSREQWFALQGLSTRGVAGGRTYDAMIVACATKIGAASVMTLNRSDFEALVPDAITVECPIDPSDL